MANNVGVMGEDGVPPAGVLSATAPGEATGFAAFFAAEQADLLRFCWGLTLDRDDALDVAQEAQYVAADRAVDTVRRLFGAREAVEDLRRRQVIDTLVEVQHWQRSVPGVIAVKVQPERCYPVYWTGFLAAGPDDAPTFFDWYEPGSGSGSGGEGD